MIFYKFRKSLQITLILFTLVVIGETRPKHLLAQTTEHSTSMAYGYYTGDKVPGNPSNEMSIMKHIYRFVQIYRQRHEGNYPKAMFGEGSFFNDFDQNIASYGITKIQDYKQSWVNPDNQYSDSPTARRDPDKFILTDPPSLRLDGNTIGSPKPIGTSDLLAATDIYFHSNDPDFKVGRKLSNPVGFYMVLWDDGDIEQIPYDQAFTVYTNSQYLRAYPGQAGVPSECLTYAEAQVGTYKTTRVPAIGYPLTLGQVEPKPDNGGIESLVQLTRLFGNNFQREQIWDLLGHQVKDFTLQDVADGAAKLKFPLQKKVITLDELQKLHTPAMLYLSDAGRIVTMSTIDDSHAIILDRGMTLIVSRAELAKRYGGEALIAASVNTPSSLQVDQPIRMLNFSSKDAEVTQNIKITNHGTKPILLFIERPLCGITEAKLSQDKLAPGASTNLELHFKWRTILPGDHQSTFVTLKTDDPAQPRLQLGFDLKLAKQNDRAIF